MDALFVRDLVIFVVSMFAWVLRVAIFLRAICSWLPFNMPPLLYYITEPILSPIRSMFNRSPLGGSMIDFSPLIALFLIQIVVNLILGALLQWL